MEHTTYHHDGRGEGFGSEGDSEPGLFHANALFLSSSSGLDTGVDDTAREEIDEENQGEGSFRDEVGRGS